MLVLFPYCYFGQLAGDSFQKMSDCVFELKWHEFPINSQKYVVLMITNMQKPIYYHGFHVTVMDLNTFLNVSRGLIQINTFNKFMNEKNRCQKFVRVHFVCIF